MSENNQRLMLSVLFPEMKWSIAFPGTFSILVFAIPAAVLSWVVEREVKGLDIRMEGVEGL